MDDRYKKYYKQMWATKCARFNAHKRLETTDARATRAIIILTFSVLAISIFKAGAFFEIGDKAQKASDLVLILCSAALLVGELYVRGQKYSDIARQFHKSGTEIARIYDEYVFEVSKLNPDDVRVLAKISEYHDAISRTDVNHTHLDYENVISQHPDDYGVSRWKRALYGLNVSTRTFLHSGGLFNILSCSVLVAAISMIYFYALH